MPRPSQPILSVDRISQAALQLIDSGHPFGVNALARALGVTPSSLYKHVTGRDEIIELVRGLLARTYDDGRQLESWEDVVENHLRVERRIYTEHPHVVPLIASLTVTHDAVIARIDRLASVLLDAGFPDDDVLVIIQLMDALAIGSGLEYAAPDDIWVPATETETLGRLLATASRGHERSDRAFEIGVRMLIATLQEMLDAHHPA